MVPDAEIREIVAAGSDLEAACRALIERANDAGGRDNVTVVVVDIESDDDGADERTLPREVLSRPTVAGEGR
jgi:protein phosphatase